MTKKQIEHYIKNIKISGHLCLNIEENPKNCRILFSNIVEKLLSNNSHDLNKVELLELPTNEFQECDTKIVSKIGLFSNLKSCLLKGGRYGKNGVIGKGEFSTLPDTFFSLVNLHHLDLCFNSITELPKCLTHLKNLKILNLDFNNISQINKECCKLINLNELYLRNNTINLISEDILQLSEIQVLNVSGNKLTNLPDVWHNLKCLIHLDVSDNNLENLPQKLFLSSTLQYVVARHNFIEWIPHDVEMLALKTFDLQYNHITNIPFNLKKNPSFLFDGNSSKYNSQNETDCSNIYNVPKYTITSDLSDLKVIRDEGAHFYLPLNIEIIFPKHVYGKDLEIYSKIMESDDTDFQLNDSDQLLSKVLKLTPNGLSFSKPVKIILPFTFTSFDKQHREIIVRTTTHCENSGFNYEDLRSKIIDSSDEGNSCKGRIETHVSHFSRFAVVSRLIENKVTLKTDSDHTLFSSVDTFTKIYFPKDSVSEDTHIKIKLLSVDPSLVTNIAGDDSYASNILHVQVQPEQVFKKLIRVHIALPEPLMGKPFNSKEIHLLKSKSNSNDWNDITNDVNLIFTTVDASFQTRSFSRYWLVWENICGVARLIYKKLTTYKVQFIALQKKELPSMVKAQCVRVDQTQTRIKELMNEGYIGSDCYSGVQELMEGDRFRVKVGGDIRLKTYNEIDRKYMEEKILVKRFYSQFPPETSGFCRFCIESTQELEKLKAVTGYISFYKILHQLCTENQILSTLPQSEDKLSSKRKHSSHVNEENEKDDENMNNENNPIEEKVEHLDDVLIALKKNELTLNLPEEKEYELNFGELGTGMFKESNLRYIAQFIGLEWESLGSYLNISCATMDRIKMDNPGNTAQQVFLLLKKWAMQHRHEDDCVESFMNALMESGRTDLAHKVNRIYQEGAENFRNTMKRRKES